MADERRRLIYELLVEAKGAKEAQDKIGGLGDGFAKLSKIAGPTLGLLAAGLTVRGIGQAIDDMTKFNQQMATLGVTGKAAAQGLADVQNIAVATGQSMDAVTGAFQSAVQLSAQLGRSTADAARTTDAFVRIAAAEGKTAEAAAHQIETLAFALDSGVLAGKQFTLMLRESNTFQSAAQNALGMTTAQLVELGKAGDISATQLTKIVLEMERIGGQTAAASTMDSLTTSAGNLIKTLAQGFGQGAGLGGGPKKLIDPDAISTSQKIADGFRGAGVEIGAFTRLAKNSLDLVGDEIYLFGVSLSDYDEPTRAWAKYHATRMEDLEELAKAQADLQRGFLMGTTSDPNYSPEADAARRAAREKANQAAMDAAFGKDLSRGLGSTFDDSVARWKKGLEQAAELRAKALEKDKADREKRDREEMDAYIEKLEAQGRLAEAAAKRRAEMEKDIQKGLDEFAKKNEKDLAESVAEMGKVRIEGLRKTIFEEIDLYTEAAFVIKDAFADLFSGGIHNAREFFQVIAQGLARIFAQMAAMKVAEGIMDWLGPVFKGIGSSSGASLGGSWAKGGAFDRGQVIPMSRGAVVNGPTVFPMARGAVGLMGEAGPEAVMPLRRMASGRLGVSAAMPNIQIINQTGVAATARVSRSGDRLSIVMEAAQLGARMAEDRFNRSVRTGYGSTAQSVQSVYGLRRRV